MTKHYTEQEIETYRKRLLPAPEILAVNQHLAVCDECYGKFHTTALVTQTYEFARTELAAAETEEPEHLSFDEILAFVDGELDEIERGIAGVHLEICPDCEDVRRELRLFKADLASGKVYAPVERSPFREKFAFLWRSYRIPIKILAASGAAAALIWFIGSSQREIRDLRNKLSQLEGQNSQPRSYASEVAELKEQLEQLNKENRELHELANSPKSPGASPISPVSLNDRGGRVVLDDRGSLNGIDFLSADHRAAVIDALRTGRVKANAELSFLRGEQKRLMGFGNKGESFIPLAPVASVVATTQPTFRWKRVPGATAYTVTIYRNNFKEIVSSQTLTGTQWTPPPLARDATYSWQIRVLKDNSEMISPSPDSREARFRVLSQSEIDRVERIKEAYANSHLALGVLYARIGLFEEAETEFRSLLAANPGSALAQTLLRSVAGRM